MSAPDWLVVAAGLSAIVAVNWYFFFAEQSAVVVTPGVGGSQVTIRVYGGYEPAVVHARVGVPLRLTFDRQETSSCSEEVVIPGFGIRRALPAFQQTSITVTPTAPGSYEFTCGMSMLRGRIVAE